MSQTLYLAYISMKPHMHHNQHENTKGVIYMKEKTPCCDDPKLIGYPTESPVSFICFKCGEWT